MYTVTVTVTGDKSACVCTFEKRCSRTHIYHGELHASGCHILGYSFRR